MNQQNGPRTGQNRQKMPTEAKQAIKTKTEQNLSLQGTKPDSICGKIGKTWVKPDGNGQKHAQISGNRQTQVETGRNS